MFIYVYCQVVGICQVLFDCCELVLIDVCEEVDFVIVYLLFVVNLLFSKLEFEVCWWILCFIILFIVYDNGEGLVEIVVEWLWFWGYQDVVLLVEGFVGWCCSGGELFQDVNFVSKVFGELVESVCYILLFNVQEVQVFIDSWQEVVIVDVWCFDEYQIMSIFGSISVFGGELVLWVESLMFFLQMLVIVNCVGCICSIIGIQLLINVGVLNLVYVLCNGIIGWMLVGQMLVYQ